MKKVISIALFGQRHEGYAAYLPSFVLAHHSIFPADEGWSLRVHVDSIVDDGRHGRFIARLADAGLVDVARMGPAILTRAMLWRMAPVFEEGVDYAFPRDLDACPMPRDRKACDQFIFSACVVSTVHDNMAHAGIMGGLCGFHAPKFREAMGLQTLDDLYARAKTTDAEWAQHGTDQNVLNRLICRPGGPILLEHRFNGWTEGKPGAYRREAGIYECAAYSTPLSDAGTSVFVGEVARQADRLANHLGAAGYDHEAARRFYEEYGDPSIARRVRECEG